MLNGAVPLMLPCYADQSEFDVGRLQRTTKRLSRAQAHSFEIFFPLAGGEHQDEWCPRLRGANGSQEVPIRPIGEVFFAKDELD